MKPSALLIIDVQVGIDDPAHGERSTPEAEENMASLLAAWRSKGWPILHVQHNSVEPDSPLRPGLPGHALKPEVQPLPDEPLFQKTTNSAFVGTDVEAYLRERAVRSLVIMGLTTDHCVSASTRSASDLGFDVTVVADATATHERIGFDGKHFPAAVMHQVNLASLNEEFGRVRTTAELLRDLESVE